MQGSALAAVRLPRRLTARDKLTIGEGFPIFHDVLVLERPQFILKIIIYYMELKRYNTHSLC